MIFRRKLIKITVKFGVLICTEKKKFIPLYFARFSISLGITMLLNFIAIYADLYQASGFWIGMVTTSFTVVQLVTLFPIGWISDLFNKKVILLSGLGILGFRILVLFSLMESFR